MERNIIYIIKERLHTLSKSEKNLAEWIMLHPQDVIHMNVTSLAENANSSPATIVRLCRSLGLKGFTDLKLHLSIGLPQIKEKLHTDIVKNEDIQQIKKKLKFNLSNSFDETIYLLNNESIETCVQLIDKSDVIFTYGIGASGLVSEDLFQKFTRIGKLTFFSKDHHLLATAISSNDKKSMFIAISNSGEKTDVINLAKVAREQGLPVVVMTSRPDSSLALMADTLLLTASGSEPPIRSSAISSMMVQLYAADIIFSTYASRHYDDTVNHLNRSKQVIKKIE